jgi:enoyl-CoA hydratase
MSHFETLTLDRQGPVVWLALNRPERLNALSRELLAELEAALASIAEDDSVRVTVLHGNGRSFSAGFDVSPPAPTDEGSGGYGHHDVIADMDDLELRLRRLMAVWDHPTPVIAAVHGHCLAAATVLAICCDLTVVADDAVIGLPSLPLGGGFLSPIWVHLVGPKRAKHMSFAAGSRIDGKTAATWGWANYSVPAADLTQDVTRLAAEIAKTPADILKVKKQAVNRMVELSGFRTGAELGPQTDAIAHQSPGVATIRAAIAELGVKEAVKRFESGDLRL